VARLLAECGPDMSLPDARKRVAGGCPRLQSVSISNLCGVMFPTLRLRAIIPLAGDDRQGNGAGVTLRVHQPLRFVVYKI
jgi:hypothetical protein